jgi:threonine dehydrogenase-like Zn-dependent dehydrogenase
VQTDLVPGGFAETLAVGPLHLANAVFPLPAEVSDLAGTLLEPLSCVLRALDTGASLLTAYPAPEVQGLASADLPGRLAPAPGDDPEIEDPASSRAPGRVLVAGCGAVGLLFLSVLASRFWPGEAAGGRPNASPRGTEELFYLEPRDERAALARNLGAEPLDSTGAEARQVQLAVLTAPPALPQVVEAMVPGGVVLIFAAEARPSLLDLDLVYRRELTLAGVRSGSPAHLRSSLRLLASGRLDLSWLRPLTVGLSGLPSAVERYARGEVLKVVVQP